MFKARRCKRIWLHSKKGKNFKRAEIWDAGWKVAGKKIQWEELTTDYKGFQMPFKVVWILSLGKQQITEGT